MYNFVLIYIHIVDYDFDIYYVKYSLLIHNLRLIRYFKLVSLSTGNSSAVHDIYRIFRTVKQYKGRFQTSLNDVKILFLGSKFLKTLVQNSFINLLGHICFILKLFLLYNVSNCLGYFKFSNNF